HNAELYQDGQLVANSLTEVTAKVERRLGMTHDEFFNTYFTGQKDLAVMAQLSRPERAAFLSRVLRYEQLSLAQERIREQKNALTAELHGREAGLGGARPGDGGSPERSRPARRAARRARADRAAEARAGRARAPPEGRDGPPRRRRAAGGADADHRGAEPPHRGAGAGDGGARRGGARSGGAQRAARGRRAGRRRAVGGVGAG